MVDQIERYRRSIQEPQRAVKLQERPPGHFVGGVGFWRLPIGGDVNGKGKVLRARFLGFPEHTIGRADAGELGTLAGPTTDFVARLDDETIDRGRTRATRIVDLTD